MAWDGTNLWNVDNTTGKLYKLDPEDGSTLDSFNEPGTSSRGLTWDGEALWVSDIATDLLYRVDPDDGSTLDTLDVFSGENKGGLAWDGSHLWISRDGLLVVLYRVDPSDGSIDHSINSAGAVHRGLEWDP